MFLAYLASGLVTCLLVIASIALFCPGLIVLGYLSSFLVWFPSIWREEIFMDKVNKFIELNKSRIDDSLVGYKIIVDDAIVYQQFKPVTINPLADLRKIRTCDKSLKRRLDAFLTTPTHSLELSLKKFNEIRYAKL